MKKTVFFLCLAIFVGFTFFSSIVLSQPGPGYGPNGPGMMWGGGGTGYGPGMMGGGYGPGYGMGPGMMGWGNYPYAYPGKKIDENELKQIAQNYLHTTGNPDLTFTGYIEYAPGYAIGFKEKSSGIHAFEIYIDKIYESAYPEMGPYMMWNTKYGHMMMGNYSYGSASQMSITEKKAKSLAEEYIKSLLPNASLDNDIETFYGFYEFVIKVDGKPYSHLFVNGYTGQDWYWNPHGPIIQIKKFK